MDALAARVFLVLFLLGSSRKSSRKVELARKAASTMFPISCDEAMIAISCCGVDSIAGLRIVVRPLDFHRQRGVGQKRDLIARPGSHALNGRDFERMNLVPFDENNMDGPIAGLLFQANEATGWGSAVSQRPMPLERQTRGGGSLIPSHPWCRLKGFPMWRPTTGCARSACKLKVAVPGVGVD